MLVAVAAAGVNRPDVMQRKGQYPPPPGAPDIPGLEISGLVARVGEGVTRFKKGDEVVALVAGGGYAEYCAAHESTTLPLPEPLTLVEGAGIPETTFTVWHNVFERGGLQAGRVAARAWRRRAASARPRSSLPRPSAPSWSRPPARTRNARRSSGSAPTPRSTTRRTDFVEALIEATRGHGADVILDMVGGDYLARNIAAAAPEGRIVQISTLAGPKTEIDLRQIMQKRLTLTGSTLRNRPVAFKAELARALEETVWPVIKQGRYKPVIDKHLSARGGGGGAPADRWRRAHRQDHPDDDGMSGSLAHLGDVLELNARLFPGQDRRRAISSAR